jgi:hypothetical protein
VLRRGDGSLRFARVEAQYQDEVVLVLGPDPNIKPSGKKDKVSAVPFRLVKRSEAGKLILDDWVPHDEAQPPEDEDTVCVRLFLSLSLARSLSLSLCERARRERRGSNVDAIRCGARGVSLGLSCPLPLPHAGAIGEPMSYKGLVAHCTSSPPYALLRAHTHNRRASRHVGGKPCGNRMQTPRRLPPTVLRGRRPTPRDCLGSKASPNPGKVSLTHLHTIQKFYSNPCILGLSSA